MPVKYDDDVLASAKAPATPSTMKELKHTLWKAASGVPVIPKPIEDRLEKLQRPNHFLHTENGMTARASNAGQGLARIGVERLNDELDHSVERLIAARTISYPHTPPRPNKCQRGLGQ